MAIVKANDNPKEALVPALWPPMWVQVIWVTGVQSAGLRR